MDATRALPPAGADVAGLVRSIVVPTAGLLNSEDGRDFLRIMEQLAGWSGLAEGNPRSWFGAPASPIS
jgi:hypothetical protein